MRPLYDAVLFDLDGTLTKSHPGILHCVELSLQELGKPVPPQEELRRFIGPPLWFSYTRFCGLSPEEMCIRDSRLRAAPHGGAADGLLRRPARHGERDRAHPVLRRARGAQDRRGRGPQDVYKRQV